MVTMLHLLLLELVTTLSVILGLIEADTDGSDERQINTNGHRHKVLIRISPGLMWRLKGRGGTTHRLRVGK